MDKPKASAERRMISAARLDHIAIAFTRGQDLASADLLVSIESAAVLETDFIEPAGTTLPTWLTTTDTSAAGSPTLDYLDDEINGAYTATLAATDEAETIGLVAATKWIDPTKESVTLFAFKVNGAGSGDDLLSADQRFVAGLASAHNDTLDSVASHAWFRGEGGSLNLLWETDDGTTDDDDNDSGIDYADDTYIRCAIRIDAAESVARFYVNGAQVGEGDLSGLSSSDVLGFTAIIQKDAGTETDALVADYLKMIQSRS